MTKRTTSVAHTSKSHSFWSLLILLLFLQINIIICTVQMGNRFVADDGYTNAQFGSSIFSYGNFTIVGDTAFNVSLQTINQGVAYIYERDGLLSYNQMNTLILTDGKGLDYFGCSVGLYENYAVVGAYNKTIENNIGQGAVYVFNLTNGNWIQQQQLIASDGAANDEFGWSVAIYGNYIAVGARFVFQTQNMQGAVYVFTINENTWTSITKLLTSDASFGDYFGSSVVMNENFIVASSPEKGVDGTTYQGVVYVFSQDNLGIWVQKQELIASDGDNNDFFGSSLSIYENNLFVGSRLVEGVHVVYIYGNVYYFQYNGNEWVQSQEIINGINNDNFGDAIFSYENYLLIGASGIPSIYLYEFDSINSNWTFLQEYAPCSSSSNNFGSCVSIQGGDTLLSCNPSDTVNSNSNQGSVCYEVLFPSITLQETTFLHSTSRITTLELTTYQQTTGFTTFEMTTMNHNSGQGIPENTIIIIVVVVVVFILLICAFLIGIFCFIRRKLKENTYLTTPTNNVELNSNNLQVIHSNNTIKGEIILGEEVGRGNFGEVYKGKLDNKFQVACKTLQEGIKTNEGEIKILSLLKHENIVQFIGIKVINNVSYMVMEFMNIGNLLTYIRKNEKTLSQENYYDYSYQITCGMNYLEENNIIHRDLALRNILCQNDGNRIICKISDFGLSKIIPNDMYYYKQNNDKEIAVKWCAPEVLFKENITSKSDVFSFGVLLYEIFSGGEQPWVGMSNVQVIDSLRSGKTMPIPKNFGPEFIIEQMHDCWDEDPHKRPTFKRLKFTFSDQIETIEKTKQENIVHSQHDYESPPEKTSSHEYELTNSNLSTADIKEESEEK